MKRVAWCATLLLAVSVGRCDGVAGQSRPAPAGPEAAASEPQPALEFPREWDPWRPILRIGQDYTLRAGDAVREVVIVFGDATIEGHVDRNVVVVFGRAQLAATASIDGALVVVGGTAAASTGAVVRDDLMVVGGRFEAPEGFTPGRQHIVIGPAALGARLEAFVPWVTRGLLWGRLIVPELPWVWGIVGVFFLVYLALNFVFAQPVRACAVTLAERPLSAFVVGLLVLLLTGPVCVLLAVSVIGIAVVPFVVCAVLVAGILGKVATARWIGMHVAGEESSASRLQSLRSFVIGFAVICVAYMVPVLGFLTWTLLGVFGLGAAALAFVAGYRRENPVPVRGAAAAAASAPVALQPAVSYRTSASASTGDASGTAEDVATAPGGAGPAADLGAFPFARFLDRLAAFALDVILVLIAHELLALEGREGAIFLMLLAYHIGFWTWKGTTVGGIICQLRVIRVDGAPLRFIDALVRGLSSIFSLAVLGLGGLWILRDPERQAWHDKIAGTYVVKVPRNHPL